MKVVGKKKTINYQTYERIAGGQRIKVRPVDHGKYYYTDSGEMISRFALVRYYKWVNENNVGRPLIKYETSVNGFRVRANKDKIKELRFSSVS